MNLRDQNGRTLLFKAIANDYSNQFIKALFKYGVNITSRDSCGRTARDFAETMKKPKYFNVIDEEIISIVASGDLEKLQQLVLQGYDHILDITDKQGFNMLSIIQRLPLKGNKQDILTFMEKIPSIRVSTCLTKFHNINTFPNDKL